ncbi:Calmodulin-binding protein 60 G [Spatholobus suberectus]|nr:Calmodulin-binding protein 60 G [Spatholobus suberectus]
MASKRTYDEENHQGNDDRDLHVRAKRRNADPQQVEVTNLFTVLEPLLRKVMEEVIPPMLQRYMSPCCRSCLNQRGATSGGRTLQLCFVNRLPSEIFTLANLTAKGGGPLQIELRYAESQQRVVTEVGSTMKAQICVLDGDFGFGGNEDWTAEEFDAQTKEPREGRGQLLKGDKIIELKNGVASINQNIVFTDNSCWTRSKTFRLGVKIVQSNSARADIREGRSESFKVKDNRGESYKKHDRPSLTDKVWRLKSIAKGGKLHRQLSSNGVKTVKDLLRLNTTGSLREKFGNINTWGKIIAHAKDCELDDDECYMYLATEQLTSLVFNCIYEVVEVNFYGQNCGRPLQSLNLEEKRLVERVKQEAYKNLQYLVPIETTQDDIVKTLTGTLAAPYGAPEQGLRQPFLIAPQDGSLLGFDQLRALRGKVPLNSCAGGQVVPEEAYVNDANGINGWALTQMDQFDFGSCFTPNHSNQWEQPNCAFPCGEGASCSNPSFFPNTAVDIRRSKGKSKTVWQKIRNALKWVIPHVAKSRAKHLRRQY